MARTRQKKRVITTQASELDQVIEDEAGENQQPNQQPNLLPEIIPEPELEPSPPKKIRSTRKPVTATKVTRTTRATVKRTAAQSKIGKSDSGPTPPPPTPPVPQQPRPASTIPTLIVSENILDDSDINETQPEIIIPRLPNVSDYIGTKKSVSIVEANICIVTPKKDEISSPNESSGQLDDRYDEPIESPKDVSYEQIRNYMSPNDALSSTTLYVTLGNSLSPQMNNSNVALDDLSNQLTQRASSYLNKNIHDKTISNSCNQSIESEPIFDSTYYFIKTSPEDENNDIMERAYFCLVSRGLHATQLDPSEVDKLPEDNESVNFYFVLPEFDGPLFEKIKNHPRWKAFLPIGLLHFHSRSTPIRDHPVMDFSMRNCFITVSGFPREVRKNLENKIRFMAGQVSSSIKDRTTHVVASSWNTEKCLYSRTHGYPLVMSPDWVEFCWENIHQDEAIDALEFSYNRNCRLPVFSGFIISGANLSRRGQERLCDLVCSNGGTYQNIIDPFRTTHLVLVKKEGPNYEKALESERIKIVQPNWIHESIARGYPLPEQDVSTKKLVNRMLNKFMDFMGVVSSVYTDSTATELSSPSLASDVRVPGSPELSEDEIDDESAADQEPNELE